MKLEQQNWRASALAAGLFACTAQLVAQGSDVSLRIDILRDKEGARNHSRQSAPIEAVVWLSSASSEPRQPTLPPRTFTLTQKEKQFTPHLLVVPTGSSVDFPNLDPFFHNVFSLFNGKRFDLGLYEAHSYRAVRFDREGISYIFCNIHPQMGAVVVSLSTPFYAASQPNGLVTLHNVPGGLYRLHIWAEDVPVEQLAALEREIKVDPTHKDLGVFRLQASGAIMDHHENKFGKEYTTDPKKIY